MYAYITGKLIFSTPSSVILENQGIGFHITVPHSVFSKLPQNGESILIYTTFIVRELSHALYGFLSMEEKDTFELLMNVTGVGPKLALSLIGHLSLNQLQNALNEKDLPTLCRVPGVGKKTAERLVVELKDKISTFNSSSPSVPGITISQEDPKNKRIQDAILTMINLGYNQNTAQKAIQKSLAEFTECPDLATLITISLKNI